METRDAGADGEMPSGQPTQKQLLLPNGQPAAEAPSDEVEAPAASRRERRFWTDMRQFAVRNALVLAVCALVFVVAYAAILRGAWAIGAEGNSAADGGQATHQPIGPGASSNGTGGAGASPSNVSSANQGGIMSQSNVVGAGVNQGSNGTLDQSGSSSNGSTDSGQNGNGNANAGSDPNSSAGSGTNGGPNGAANTNGTASAANGNNSQAGGYGSGTNVNGSSQNAPSGNGQSNGNANGSSGAGNSGASASGAGGH